MDFLVVIFIFERSIEILNKQAVLAIISAPFQIALFVQMIGVIQLFVYLKGNVALQ